MDNNNKSNVMKTKVLSAIIGIPLCCIAMFILPIQYATAFFSLICGLAVYEFTYKTGMVKNNLKIETSVVFAVLVPWLFYFECSLYGFIFSAFLFLCLLLSESMLEKHKSDVNELFVCSFGAMTFPILLSLCVVLLKEEHGKILLALPFISSWVADSFANIIGSAFGKHKLAPHISPNKTVEGAIGAVFGGVIGMEIYALILTLIGYKVNWLMFTVIGILGAVFGMLGDLSLSYIKRKCNIKDYGNLIPGHGGVLDRFDSTMFVIPVVLFIVKQTTLIY